MARPWKMFGGCENLSNKDVKKRNGRKRTRQSQQGSVHCTFMIREHHPKVADWPRRCVNCRGHAARTAQFQPPLTWNRFPGMLVNWLSSADFARCFFYYTGCSLSNFIRQKRKEEPFRAGRRVTASSTRAKSLHRCLRGVSLTNIHFRASRVFREKRRDTLCLFWTFKLPRGQCKL